MTIIPKGVIKMVQTDVDGKWVDKSQLSDKYADGLDIIKDPSSFDAPIDLCKTIS